MKISKLLVAIVLLVGAVYGGVKGYVYYQTRSAVKHFVEQVSPFVTVEYRGVSSTLSSGTIQVEGLILRPNGIADTISVRSITLRTGGLRSLIKLTRNVDDKQIPNSLAFGLNGVSVSLDGALLRMADRFLTASQAAAGTAVTAPHCGNQPTVGFAFLRRLGYENLAFDLNVNYDMNKGARLMNVGIDVNLPEMNHVSVDVKLSNMSDVPDLKNPPSVREFGFFFKDLSYKDRLKKFCMQMAKISEADYLKAETEEGNFYRQAGITPGPGLQAAYRDFLTTPNSEIRIRAYPNEGFDPKGMAFYQPADVLRQLNATVTVNNKPVEDLSFTFGVPATAKPKEAVADSAESTAPRQPETNTPAVDAKIQRVKTREDAGDGFRTIGIADLGRHLNRNVRLTERGQQPREGVLTQVAAGTAFVERRYGSGNMVVKVPLANLEKAEVQE